MCNWRSISAAVWVVFMGFGLLGAAGCEMESASGGNPATAAPLEFRIAATGQPEKYLAVLEALERDGAGAEGAGWKWFELRDLGMFVDSTQQHDLERLGVAEYFSQTRDLIVEEHDGGYYMLLFTTPERRLTQEDGDWELRSVRATSDRVGRPAVAFTLNDAGGERMGRLTRNHIGEPLALLVDGQVVTAPTISGEIRTRGEITGRFSQEDIDELLAELRGR